MKLIKGENQLKKKEKEISDEEAEDSIRRIIQWIGEDPSREGLLSTPKRVIKAFKEYYQGYKQHLDYLAAASPLCLGDQFPHQTSFSRGRYNHRNSMHRNY